MSQSTILAKIKSTLEGVTDIGQVHDYVRWNADWSDMLTMFRDSSTAQIRFWDITRKRTAEEARSGRTNYRTHIFRIRGFMSLDDSESTEKTFQDLIEQVVAVFRNQPTLGGVALTVEPLQVDNVDHAVVTDILCHMVESTISIVEKVQWTE